MINPMSAFALMTLTVLFFALQVTADRTSEVRYVNSMPQFGKANVTASPPVTALFNNVPQGFITGYTTLTAKTWTFTTKFSTNASAVSDPTDVDSDSFGTLFTCQAGEKLLKNWLIYDNTRASSPRKASVRAVNLAQYNYPIDIYSDDGTITFEDVDYCTETSYKDVVIGEHYVGWTLSNKKRNTQQLNGNGTEFTFLAGKAYTIYVTPLAITVVLDGRRPRDSKRNPLLYVKAEDTPKNDNNNGAGEEEDVNNVAEAGLSKANNLKKRVNKRSKIAGNPAK